LDDTCSMLMMGGKERIQNPTREISTEKQFGVSTSRWHSPPSSAAVMEE